MFRKGNIHNSSTLEWYSRLTKRGIGRLIHGLVKNAVLRKLYRSLFSFQFGVYSDSKPHLWLHILGNN